MKAARAGPVRAMGRRERAGAVVSIVFMDVFVDMGQSIARHL
jgi:hypothetical protein